MENQETLEFLSQCFHHALSPNPEPRRLAESKLAEASERPNYCLALLRLVSEPSMEEQIRQAAAVNFKNHLRSRWIHLPPSESNEITSIPIIDSEKELIKSSIVPLMLSSSSRVRSQLSEALSIIGKHDFPKFWPALLPELVLGLQKASQSSDYTSINGILSTANSIFKKFRYQYKTNDLLLDLKYCLDNFAAPLLEIFLRTAALIDSALSSSSTASSLRSLIESQRLCCRIFFSLNFQELPEFFEDHMNEWMTEFKKHLTTTYQSVEASGVDGVAFVDELRSAVCENITLYMEKNEEEFKSYLNDFALAVWSLLANVSTVSSREILTIKAMKFLTTISTSVHHSLFAGESAIQQIFVSIVIPNIQVRAEDEELFEMNHVEFIRRDMEGSDLDTRRRSACELIKGLASNYKEEVTRIVSSEIQNRISSFSANPSANWKDKESAIYLIVSLANKNAKGHTVSTDLVDFHSFFGSIIGPELRSTDVNSFPMLKAGALKFFTLFRNQITKSMAAAFFPEVIRFLVSDSNVVHSYAAICIEKLLLVKEDDQKPRFSVGDVSPVLPVLMTNLFNAFKCPESEENPYVMKCIMRVIGLAEISSNVAGPCIAGLTSILTEVCKNPKTPTFNHYLFESVAALVRRACEKDPSLLSAFETSLFPSLQMILANDVTEFFPYAFQLLSQLVELNKPPIPPSYMQIFDLLLSPDSWKRKADVQALVRLLQAFLQKTSHEPNLKGRLSEVLGIFKMLVDNPATDEQGFYVLNTITESVSYDVISPYMSHIWVTLFNRLQVKRILKFVKSFLIFMSLFLVKHSYTSLVNSMNAVQPAIFLTILEQFWIPHVKLITGAIELKLTSVASTRLLVECPVLLDSGSSKLWGKLLDGVVTLISQPEENRVQEEPEIPDFGGTCGYTTTFIPLYNAGKKEEDPLSDVKNPREYLVASLANLSSRSPGRYPQIIKEHLDPANQAALLQFCSTYKLLIL